jgi:hypothetical protein
MGRRTHKCSRYFGSAPSRCCYLVHTHRSANAHNRTLLHQNHEHVTQVGPDIKLCQKESNATPPTRISAEELTTAQHNEIFGPDNKKDLLPFIAVGCPVRVTHNYDKKKGTVNGATGTVTGWNTATENMYTRVTGIYVQLDTGGKSVRVGRLDYTARCVDGVPLPYAHFGLALNYACTIHSTQGATITRPVFVDITEVFEYGLLYVALSRATNPDHIFLSRPVTVHDLRVINISAFYDALKLT